MSFEQSWLLISASVHFYCTVHSTAEYDGSRVSLVTIMAPLCQQGGILDVAENDVPVLELDKFPEVQNGLLLLK